MEGWVDLNYIALEILGRGLVIKVMNVGFFDRQKLVAKLSS
jgi:hypothetical protein